MTAATHCSDCGVELPHNPRRKGTRCQTHARAQPCTPERRAALAAAMRAKHADPHFAAARAANLRKARARMVKEGHPVLEKYAASLRANRINPSVAGSDERRLAIAKGVATRLAHIPLEHRDMYRSLMVSQGLRAAERARIVLAHAARAAERYVAGLFNRKEAA